MVCPFCDSPRRRPKDALSGSELQKIYATSGHQIGEAAFGAIQSETRVDLMECDDCGGAFFDPRFAGDADFYAQLEGSSYYVPWRPEFDFALAAAHSDNSKRVLDIGCGSGAFLDHAMKSGLETYGLELNPVAASSAAEKGHGIIDKPLATVTCDDFGGPLDLITLFHVLEHVPQPVAVLASVYSLLGSNGRVVFAVPNENGLYRFNPLDPLNWPPHHLTRWRPSDSCRVLERAGFVQPQISGDPLYGRGIAAFWKQYQLLAYSIGRRHRPPNALPAVLSFFYRKLGLRFIFSESGLSLRATARIHPKCV